MTFISSKGNDSVIKNQPEKINYLSNYQPDKKSKCVATSDDAFTIHKKSISDIRMILF